MAKDYFAEEILNNTKQETKDYFSEEIDGIAQQDTDEPVDKIADIGRKITGISQGPNNFEQAVHVTAQSAKGIVNSAFAGIPGMLFEEMKPKGLSPQQELDASLAGMAVPVTGILKYGGKLTKPVGRTIGKFFAPGKRSWQQMMKSLNVATNTKYGIALKEATKKAAQNGTDAVNAIKGNITTLGDDLAKAADRASVNFQKHLPSFFKANSKAYGDKVDEIMDIVSKSGKDMSRQEVHVLHKKVLAELDEAGINSGVARETIEELVKKYEPVLVGKPSKFVNASTGVRPTINASNADDLIPMKELLSDYKRMNKTLSTGFKSGNYGFTPEDISVAVYKKEVGESLKTIAPEWGKLNEAYRPVIEAKKASYRLFKPAKGDMFAKSGQKFIERAAGQGKGLAESEKRFLSFLEGGSDLAVGVGNLSDEAVKVGNEIAKLKQSIEPTKALIKGAGAKRIAGINAEKAKRLLQLQNRRKQLELLSAQRAKAQTIQKALLGGAAATGVVSGSSYWAGRHIMGSGR